MRLNTLDKLWKNRSIEITNHDDEDNSRESCEEIPPTVVLNYELIVEYQYAMFHHDDEDVVTGQDFFNPQLPYISDRFSNEVTTTKY